jgi:hypothetical protein
MELLKSIFYSRDTCVDIHLLHEVLEMKMNLPYVNRQ